MYPEVPAKNYPAFSSISRPMRVVQGTCGSSTASAENRGLRELPLESDEHIPFLSSNFMFSDFEGGVCDRYSERLDWAADAVAIGEADGWGNRPSYE